MKKIPLPLSIHIEITDRTGTCHMNFGNFEQAILGLINEKETYNFMERKRQYEIIQEIITPIKSKPIKPQKKKK